MRIYYRIDVFGCISFSQVYLIIFCLFVCLLRAVHINKHWHFVNISANVSGLDQQVKCSQYVTPETHLSGPKWLHSEPGETKVSLLIVTDAPMQPRPHLICLKPFLMDWLLLCCSSVTFGQKWTISLLCHTQFRNKLILVWQRLSCHVASKAEWMITGATKEKYTSIFGFSSNY